MKENVNLCQEKYLKDKTWGYNVRNLWSVTEPHIHFNTGTTHSILFKFQHRPVGSVVECILIKLKSSIFLFFFIVRTKGGNLHHFVLVPK